MASKNKTTAGRFSLMRRLYRSVWFFPAILLCLLLLLTALRISGTSIGMYHEVLYGNTQKDPHLLVGNPQPIRSDEWLFVTQMTIAQHAAGYPLVNHNIGDGHNMSVVSDAPYKDWSSVFRPENLSFLVMPLEFAFAFKWWLMLFLAITGCYFVVLRFFPGRRLFGALFATAVGCTPFLFWWYQMVTLAPLYLGFFVILLGLRVIRGEGVPFLARFKPAYSYVALGLVLAYILTCFGMVLYPPFQIPVAIVIAVFLATAALQLYTDKKASWGELARRIGVLLGGAALAGVVVLLFVHTRSAIVTAVTDTAYPGHRIVDSGDTPVSDALGSFLMPQLEHTARAVQYFTNQSEASNFLLFLPFLLLPGFVFIGYEWRVRHRLDWQLLGVQLVGLLFLANMYVPHLGPLDKLFFLDKVPHQRLLIGLGFAGVLQLLSILAVVERLKLSGQKTRWLTRGYTLVCFAVLLCVGGFIRSHYPFFLHSWLFIGGLAGGFCLILLFAMTGRRTSLAVLFVLYSLGSVYHIHPLYEGLGFGTHNDINAAIDRVSPPGSTWVVLDNILFENFPALSGRDTLSGIQLYPNISFWRKDDPNPKDTYIYNRYAHVVFTTDPSLSNLKLVQSDSFQVKFSCRPFIEQHVQFALALHTLDDACVQQVATVSYPNATFYLYRVK